MKKVIWKSGRTFPPEIVLAMEAEPQFWEREMKVGLTSQMPPANAPGIFQKLHGDTAQVQERCI